MKKRIGIALALAVAFILCFNTVALAADPIELKTSNGGTTEWTDEEAAVGDYSVRLDWPAPYRDAEGNYIVPRASVAITDLLGGLTVSDVNSWSYWAKAPKYYTPGLTFYTDTVGDGNSDTTISTSLGNNPDNTWILIDETTIGGGSYWGAYVIWGSNPRPSYKFNWPAVQDSYGDAEILNLLIGKGVIGTNKDITAYVDDFTLNGITYSFEPPPPPPPPPKYALTVALPNAQARFKKCGSKALSEEIDFNDGTWRIQIPKGTWVLNGSGNGASRLVVNGEGQVSSSYRFVYPPTEEREVTITRL